MAADGDFQTATQGGAVDDGDARLGAGFDTVDHFRQTGRLRRLAEFLDVGAGHEGRAFADQDDGFDFGIRFGSLEAVLQALAYGDTQGINRGVVDPDNCNGALSFQCDHVRHAQSPSVVMTKAVASVTSPAISLYVPLCEIMESYSARQNTKKQSTCRCPAKMKYVSISGNDGQLQPPGLFAFI